MGISTASLLKPWGMLPGLSRGKLQGLPIEKYFAILSSCRDLDEKHITPEARAVFLFLADEIGDFTIRDYGRGTFAPFSYVGITAPGSSATGVGVDTVFGRALFSAVMEFLERYFLAVPPASTRPLASAAKLKRAGENFFAPDGLAESGFNGDIPTQWVEGEDLAGGGKILLPAYTVFWNYGAPGDGQPLSREFNVSGGGSAFSADDAIAYGIYELIEHDAFLRAWYRQITPPRIKLSSIADEEINFLADEAHRRGLEPFILDITSDIAVPAFMVALIGAKPPMISRGFNCNLNPLSAIKKAFCEAWGNYILNCGLLEKPMAAWRPSPMAWRYKLWLEPQSFARAKFLLEGEEILLRPGKDVEMESNELELLKEIIRRCGSRIYCFSPHDKRLDKLGVSVAKAFIPGLIPMHFGGENENMSLASPRLAGRAENLFPHPFA